MNEKSISMMTNFYNKYIANINNTLNVIEIGASSYNYGKIFKNHNFKTLNFSNADIIIKDYNWEIEKESYDVVVCGQVLEHDKFFWITLKNISYILKKNGYCSIIVPSDGPIHENIDCYRFLPDSMNIFAQIMNIELLYKELDPELPWKLLIGVFKK